jgi:hypothetical protein
MELFFGILLVAVSVLLPWYRSWAKRVKAVRELVTKRTNEINGLSVGEAKLKWESEIHGWKIEAARVPKVVESTGVNSEFWRMNEGVADQFEDLILLSPYYSKPKTFEGKVVLGKDNLGCLVVWDTDKDVVELVINPLGRDEARLTFPTIYHFMLDHSDQITDKLAERDWEEN